MKNILLRVSTIIVFSLSSWVAVNLVEAAPVSPPFFAEHITQNAKVSEYGTDIEFGASSAIDGNTAVVGAPFGYYYPTYLRQGYASVYFNTGSYWVYSAQLTIPHTSGSNFFGTSVAIKGDTIIVGSPYEDNYGNDHGAAYVFVKDATGWTLQGSLYAPDGNQGELFGQSVDISGDTAVVGAYGWNGPDFHRGSAYVFVRSNGTWSLQKQLFPSQTNQNAAFGEAVAIEGETIVVGSNDWGPGAAYIYTRSGNNWTEVKRLAPSDLANGDGFGSNVDISGRTIAVSARYDDVGTNINQGSVYLFVKNGADWDQQAKLVIPDGATQDNFGNDIDLDGECLMIGAMHRTVGSNNAQGLGYLFARSGAVWSERGTFAADDGHAQDELGSSVGVSGKNIVMGAPFANAPYTGSGAGYMFTNPLITNVSINGRVFDPNGRGLANTLVTMTDANGQSQTHLTNHFGYYRFVNVRTNSSYDLSLRSKRFSFAPRSVTVMDNITGLDFTPLP